MFAERFGGGTAVSTSYGRMAFFYVLRALGVPPGSEIVFPALTFWVVPEMARAMGLTPVFADVDPETFCLDPDALERAITARTRAVVPTHLYGLPCDMDRIMAVARRHGLHVIEDCAHALGASYRGRPVGTFGDAGFFSFQTLKPLNTYGGGMALVRDPALARAVSDEARAERCPTAGEVMSQLRLGKVQRVCARPRVFSVSLFPLLWAGSWVHARPDVYLWESIRPALAAAGRVSPAVRERPGGDRARGARPSFRPLDRREPGARRASRSGARPAAGPARAGATRGP